MNIYHLNINRFNNIDVQNIIKECYYLQNEYIFNSRTSKVTVRERTKVSLITFWKLLRFDVFIIIKTFIFKKNANLNI